MPKQLSAQAKGACRRFNFYQRSIATMIHYVTRHPTRLRPQRLGRLLLVSVVLFATLSATPAHAQENFPPCTGLVFST